MKIDQQKENQDRPFFNSDGDALGRFRSGHTLSNVIFSLTATLTCLCFLWANPVKASPVAFEPQEKVGQQELPARPDVDQAKKTIGELFRERYDNAQKQTKIKKLVEFRNLAEDILQIRKPNTPPAELFAIYEVAIDLYKKSCFAAEALRAVDSFEKKFPIDGQTIRSEFFAYWKSRLPQITRDYAERKEAFIRLTLELQPYVTRAVEDKDWSNGFRLSDLAESFSALGGDKETAAKYLELSSRLRKYAEIEADAKAGIEELKTKPSSASAKRIVGIYYCFVLEDWERGLAILKESNDARLSGFANADLAADVKSKELAGDNWWSLVSDSEYENFKVPLAKRAKTIYQSCIDDVSTISAAKLKKRIDEAALIVKNGQPGSDIPYHQSSQETGMQFVLIKPGTFRMGNKRYRDAPAHQVRLTEPFYIGIYEVTQSEWNKVMGTTPWRDQKYVKIGDRIPATWMNWAEAIEYCLRLSKMDKKTYRLPTEAEWEYACRAGSTGEYCFGSTASQLDNFAWYKKNAVDAGEPYPHPVGRKLPNKWGVYDMHGNVFEWTRDYYLRDYYKKSPRLNPVNLARTKSRTLRGGSFDYPADKCVAAFRGNQSLNFRNYTLGFRLVMEVEKKDSK